MHYNQQNAILVNSDCSPSVFIFAMLGVKDAHHFRIKKNSGCLLKTNPMFLSICLCFTGIPIKIITHSLPLSYYTRILKFDVIQDLPKTDQPSRYSSTSLKFMAYHSEFLFFEYTIFSEITLLGTMKYSILSPAFLCRRFTNT